MSDNIRIPSAVPIPDHLETSSEKKGGGKKARKAGQASEQQTNVSAEPDADFLDAEATKNHQLDIRI